METAHWMPFPRASDSGTGGGFWKHVPLYIFKPYRHNIIESSASNWFIVFISRSVPSFLNWIGLQQDIKAVEITISYVSDDFVPLVRSRGHDNFYNKQ